MLFSFELLRKTTQKTISSNKTAKQLLIDEALKFSPEKTYDIFLSHCYSDADLIYGLKLIIEKLGYTTYIDWVNDPQAERSNVTEETANLLKDRMDVCKCMIFVVTEISPKSKWMPWELGYFDGTKENKIAILPIEEDCNTNNYIGQEYLGLYPYITYDGEILFVHFSVDRYLRFGRWLNKVDC